LLGCLKTLVRYDTLKPLLPTLHSPTLDDPIPPCIRLRRFSRDRPAFANVGSPETTQHSSAHPQPTQRLEGDLSTHARSFWMA
jgi:hypothetical protein